MTEFITRFRDDELDEEDRLFRAALNDLQGVVSSFMIREGRSINDLTVDEQQALIDRISPHLKFEIGLSQDIYKGMPIVVKGPGAFLVADDEGSLVGAQITAEGDVLTGVVDDVQAYIVPTREVVLNTGHNDAVPVYDNSLSAVVIIEGATFFSSPSPDGTFQVEHDLGVYSVIIPVVYDMDARIADIAA